MAHNIRIKKRVIALRRKGNSITDISQMMRLSKSTVNSWCRDVLLTNSQLSLVRAKSRAKNSVLIERLANQKRQKRLDKVAALKARGAQRVASLTSRDRLMVGLGLYWGEGYKNTSSELGFTNSDLEMIRFFIRWLREHYDVSSRDLILRVSINQSHAKRIYMVEQYWSREVNVPLRQFTKASFIKSASKKKYSNSDRHYGTLRVKVRRGTDLWRQIMGSIEALKA